MIWFKSNKLEEMSAIGTYNNNYEVYVYKEPLGNPSFHFSKGKDWEFVLLIKDFSILEVKKSNTKMPYKKGAYIPKSYTNDLVEFFNRVGDTGITNWEYLIDTWNRNNVAYKINVKTPIPQI